MKFPFFVLGSALLLSSSSNSAQVPVAKPVAGKPAIAEPVGKAPLSNRAILAKVKPMLESSLFKADIQLDLPGLPGSAKEVESAYVVLSLSYTAIGDYDLAEKSMQVVRDAKKKSHLLAVLGKALALYGSDVTKVSEAFELSRGAAMDLTDTFDRKITLGTLVKFQAQAGDLSAARITTSQITNFEGSAAQVDVAKAMARKGDASAALERFQNVTDADMKSGWALLVVETYAQNGQLDKARDMTAKVTIPMEKLSANLALAKAQRRAGNKSKTLLDQATADVRTMYGGFAAPAAYENVALAQIEAGDLDTAQGVLRRVENPVQGRAGYIALAQALAKAGGIDEAKRVAEAPREDEYTNSMLFKPTCCAKLPSCKARPTPKPPAPHFSKLSSKPTNWEA